MWNGCGRLGVGKEHRAGYDLLGIKTRTPEVSPNWRHRGRLVADEGVNETSDPCRRRGGMLDQRTRMPKQKDAGLTLRRET